MSYDFPASIEEDIQHYAKEKRISSAEAVLELVKTGLKTRKRKAVINPLTDEEMNQIADTLNALEALGDVTDEQWNRIDKRIRRMKRSELSTRA